MDTITYNTRGLRQVAQQANLDKDADPITLLEKAMAWSDPNGQWPNLVMDAMVEACIFVKEKMPTEGLNLALRTDLVKNFDYHLSNCPEESMTVNAFSIVCDLVPEAAELYHIHAEKIRIRGVHDLQDIAAKAKKNPITKAIQSKGGRYRFSEAIINPDGAGYGHIYAAGIRNKDKPGLLFHVNGFLGTVQEICISLRDDHESLSNPFCKTIMEFMDETYRVMGVSREQKHNDTTRPKVV